MQSANSSRCNSNKGDMILMNVLNHNYRRIFICCLTILIMLLGSQKLFAYEKEIKGISATITERITKSGKKTIAVVDFTGLQGNVTELGRFLAEELSVELVNAASGFSVIDRAHLKSILAEHKLSISGIADPKAVKKLGQIAGVDAIITGSVTPLENSIRVTAKVIATDTANVIGAAKCDIAKTRAIEELLTREIDTSQPAGSSYVPSISPKTKKVGDLIITMKGVIVASANDIRVILDIFNESDDTFEAAGYSSSELNDEKGNRFSGGMISGIPYGEIFMPKSNKNMVFKFIPHFTGIDDIKDIGSNFAFNLQYILYSVKYKSQKKYSVSFTDIKAQMPK